MIIAWNCRGCASDLFIALCKDIISSHKPSILILLKTWISGDHADKIIKRLSFWFAIHKEAMVFGKVFGFYGITLTFELLLCCKTANLFMPKLKLRTYKIYYGCLW